VWYCNRWPLLSNTYPINYYLLSTKLCFTGFPSPESRERFYSFNLIFSFLIVHLLRTRFRCRRRAAVIALSDNLNNSVRCRSIAPVSFSPRPLSWPVVLFVHRRLCRTTKTRVTYLILFVPEPNTSSQNGKLPQNGSVIRADAQGFGQQAKDRLDRGDQCFEIRVRRRRLFF